MKEIQKDKHGFTVTKHKFSIRLIFKFLLTFAICVYALYRCSLRACADEITLTPEQTYALLGQRVSGLVHSNVNNQDVLLDCTAVFSRCLSSNFVPTNYIDYDFITYSPLDNQGNPTNSYPAFSSVLPDIQKRQYLVFFISPTVPGDVPTGWPSWTPTDSYAWHDLTCDFTLPIQSCTDIKFSVLYSASSTGAGYYGNVNNSTILLNNSSGVVARHPIGQAGINSRFFTLLTPFYKPYNMDLAQVPEANRVNLACVPLDFHTENYDSFSISGFNASLNMVQGYYNQNSNSPFDSVWLTSGTYTPLLYIQCPTISDYTPATTAPQTTPSPATLQPPMSTAPSETVDLSNLESGVAAIVGQLNEANNYLDWIGYNQYIAAADLDHIANTLDLIYAKMWDAGEVPQNAGLQPPDYENLRNFAASALATRASGVTTVSGFDMQGNFSAFFDVGKSLVGAPIFAPFILAASVGLGLAVFAFVLFRGH